jgi:hypothetical protein
LLPPVNVAHHPSHNSGSNDFGLPGPIAHFHDYLPLVNCRVYGDFENRAGPFDNFDINDDSRAGVFANPDPSVGNLGKGALKDTILVPALLPILTSTVILSLALFPIPIPALETLERMPRITILMPALLPILLSTMIRTPALLPINMILAAPVLLPITIQVLETLEREQKSVILAPVLLPIPTSSMILVPALLPIIPMSIKVILPISIPSLENLERAPKKVNPESIKVGTLQTTPQR